MRNRNAEWQQEWFGRHVQLVPAEFAWGYQYRPWGDAAQVQRAIPAEGRVGDPGPKWDRAPQAAYWLGEPKKYYPDAIARIMRMMRKK